MIKFDLLKYHERDKFRSVFKMQTGYVLDISDRTFRLFVIDSTGKNIYDTKYEDLDTSKAKRLVCFLNK